MSRYTLIVSSICIITHADSNYLSSIGTTTSEERGDESTTFTPQAGLLVKRSI